MAAKPRRPLRRKSPAAKPPRKGKPAPAAKPTRTVARPTAVHEKPLPADAEATPPTVFPIDFDTTEVEATLKKVAGELKHWANKGRYTKVRFKFRGKQLLPDLPLAAVVASQGLSFYWGGILRALLVTLGVNSVLQVELVNDSEKQVQQGREELLSGELHRARALFEQALQMNRDSASAHLNLGILSKLEGDALKARENFERARALDPSGAIGLEAEKLLSGMPKVPAPAGPA